MKYFFSILILVHGLIHLMGFVKAFSIKEIPQLSQSIPKNLGMLFLVTSILFILALILFLFKSNLWFIVAVVALITSQILIIIFWQDAKYGTLANIIILMAVVVAFASWNFKNAYENDVETAFAKAYTNSSQVTLEDMAHLPSPVQKYLKYVGVVNKPKVSVFKLTMKGEMRGKDQDWFAFSSQQYNFLNQPTRLFFMDARVKGLPTSGYHYYQNTKASMLIKPLSLFTVVNEKSQALFKAETVTFFNDLCLFAPSALVDDRIRWEPIDATSAKAYFSNKGTTISATLYFNEKGQLINFVSDDRQDINEKKTYRFSTPVSNYSHFNGYMLPSYGEAIWHYTEGEFVYGKFNILDIKYNKVLQ